MDARKQDHIQRIKAELAELAELIEQTKQKTGDPDMCWARELFLYRMGCLRERLRKVERMRGVATVPLR